MKKKITKILGITLLLTMITNLSCYADSIDYSLYDEYTASYYIAIILAVLIVVGISIFILKKIYKSNQTNNEEIKEMHDQEESNK